MRQLTAAAGDGLLGSVGSPGQLETSLNSGYTVGPCNSYLEGPTLVFSASRSRSILICSLRSLRSYRFEVDVAPTALELASGALVNGEDAWESARCSSPTVARLPSG